MGRSAARAHCQVSDHHEEAKTTHPSPGRSSEEIEDEQKTESNSVSAKVLHRVGKATTREHAKKFKVRTTTAGGESYYDPRRIEDRQLIIPDQIRKGKKRTNKSGLATQFGSAGLPSCDASDGPPSMIFVGKLPRSPIRDLMQRNHSLDFLFLSGDWRMLRHRGGYSFQHQRIRALFSRHGLLFYHRHSLWRGIGLSFCAAAVVLLTLCIITWWVWVPSRTRDPALCCLPHCRSCASTGSRRWSVPGPITFRRQIVKRAAVLFSGVVFARFERQDSQPDFQVRNTV